MSYWSPTSNGGSWLFSLRGWYPDSIRDTTELGGGENLDPNFADVYVKTAFNVGGRHRISAHGLLAYDRVSFEETGENINESVDASTGRALERLGQSILLQTEDVQEGFRAFREKRPPKFSGK